MDQKINIRSGWDRLRYTLIFETLLILMVGIALSYLTNRKVTDTGMLAVILSTKAVLINLVYNYMFDKFDVRRNKIPTERSTLGRITHAIGFELFLTLSSLPILMWWLGFTFWQALLLDLATMSVIVVYTYFYTICYDRIFPLAQPVKVEP